MQVIVGNSCIFEGTMAARNQKVVLIGWQFDYRLGRVGSSAFELGGLLKIYDNKNKKLLNCALIMLNN
jgi:hypothetical protein